MSNTKKIKTSQDQEDFERIKKYLNDCPFVSREHPLIQAALVAVDKEQQRVERDRKLQMKFSQQQHVKNLSVPAVDSMEDGLVVVENIPGSPPPLPTAEEEMEWQDVQDKEKESAQACFLGKTLAKVAIDKIAEHQQKVKSPLAAIAVALHACLRSDWLGFACTGIPETETSGGFAPPVRELPPYQFLPTSWDSMSTTIAFRYRKSGIGALVLFVELLDDDDTIAVRLQPSNSKEPSSQKIEFSKGEYINLDSWNTAVRVNPSVSPALHYKSLALLITQFCRTFDLGTVEEANAAQAATTTVTSVPYWDNTVIRTQRTEFIPALPAPPPVGTYRTPDGSGQVPSTFGEAFPGINPLRVGGDFSWDLAPAGVQDPRCLMDGGRMGGNLMGPNHPLFQGGDGIRGSVPLGGPGSMQPRFDPIYPDVIDFPGGQDPTRLRGKPRNGPRPSGDPNPDHLRPPNSFNGNMFS